MTTLRYKKTPKDIDEIKKDVKGNSKEEGLTNKLLSENLDLTREMWVEEGFKEITATELKSFKTTDKMFIKYITNRKLARQGGILTKIEDDYFVLMNAAGRVSWSVQFKNTKEMYARKVAPKKSKKNKPKETESDKDTDTE